MPLSDSELDRYARHIVLPEVGGVGQARIAAARVALIGAGGIGSPAIQYLAAAGIGELVVIDDDRVALSNLQRQTLFGSQDVGRTKVEVVEAAVERLNPHVRLVPLQQRITSGTAPTLLAGADVVVDGSDNFTTRLAVADAALTLYIPLVAASVSRFEGQLGTFRGWEADKPCYRCFVGTDPDRAGATCADEGVLGAMAGVMGSLAALEALRQITGFGDDTAGKLVLVDALGLRFRTIALPKDPGCMSCRHTI